MKNKDLIQKVAQRYLESVKRDDPRKALDVKRELSIKKGSYKKPRKWGRKHCESKSCDEMGFSEKASCRPYIDCYGGKTGSSSSHMNSRVASRYLRSAQRDDPKLKNTGHGGLSTWFAGHGGGKPDERATWGDWIAITPIKHTVEKENGESKTYEAGDIVGPCAISSEPSWRSVTDGGKNPLKCMPRDKAHDLTKEQRATLARKKRREEAKSEGQKPVLTPTFSEEGKDLIKDKSAARPIRIDKRPLRELTDQAWEEVEKRAEKATQKGVTYISEASRFPHFIVGKLSVGEESVYVTAEIDRDRAGSGLYISNDHHIIIRIKDYPANLSHPLVAKYANFEASFKREFLSILEHEVTHAYDKILFHKNMRGYRRKNKSVAEARRYVNHSSEVKAFLQQIASESEEYLRKNYGLSRESIRDHFMEALKKSKTYFEIGGALNPKSFKYIKSAVLTHLLDQVV